MSKVKLTHKLNGQVDYLTPIEFIKNINKYNDEEWTYTMELN